MIDHGDSGGTSSIVFPSAANRNSDYGYIKYIDAYTTGYEDSRLVIGVENDHSWMTSTTSTNKDCVFIYGPLGINTMSPNTDVDISGNLIVENGRVGINTMNPTGMLDVNAINNISGIYSFVSPPNSSYVSCTNQHDQKGIWVPYLGTGNYCGLSLSGDSGIFYNSRGSLSVPGVGGFVIAPHSSPTIGGIRLDVNGNVGINTSVPTKTLDVNGSILIRGGAIYGVAKNGAIYECYNPWNGGNGGGDDITYMKFATGGCIISVINYGCCLRIDNVGNFFLGGGSSSNIRDSNFRLDVAGNFRSDNIYQNSDYRLKENVISLRDMSDCTIDNLRPVHYFNTSTKKNDIGLIAHELLEHFPFMVTGEKDGKDMQSVNYISLIGLLIHEVQLLKENVKNLQNIIQSMQNG